MDNKLISAIYQDRDSFDRVTNYIDKNEEILSELNVILYEQAKEYYDVDPEASSVDKDVIKSFIERKYPRQQETLLIALDTTMGRELPSTLNVIKEFIEAKKYAVGVKLSHALLHNSEIEPLLEEYEELCSEEALDTSESASITAGIDMHEVMEATASENLIHILPDELNSRLGGGLLRGHHVLVFARPEVGKSMFTINMVRGFLEQGLTVVYVGNEDPEISMKKRVVSSVLNLNREQLDEEDSDDLNLKLVECGVNNFYFKHLNPGSPQQIQGLINRIEPDVIIIDQLRNINCYNEGMVQRLENAAKEIRTIGQRSNSLMISVTQAGDSATDKLVLTMSDVDSSKTGIPSQVDVMVGIGMNQEYEARNKRMISLPKNKPGGDHGFFSITVDEGVSRIL